MDRVALYNQAIDRRRGFRLPGYATLAEAGFEGAWVSPIQITSGNLTGPMLITKDWLDVPSAIRNARVLLELGYLPGIAFNVVLDAALRLVGLLRADIYVTPVFKLLTPSRSHAIPGADARASFADVTQHELLGRKPVAAGTDAIRVMQHFGIPHVATAHPSARGLDFATRAKTLAKAFEQS